MLKSVPCESIVDVTGVLRKPEGGPVQSATCSNLELEVATLFVVSLSGARPQRLSPRWPVLIVALSTAPELPFQLADTLIPNTVIKQYNEQLDALHAKIEALGTPCPADKQAEKDKLEAVTCLVSSFVSSQRLPTFLK